MGFRVRITIIIELLPVAGSTTPGLWQ